MMNIRNKIGLLREAPFVELGLGPTPWCNTRLYLVAALAHELGQTRGLVFVDSAGQFLLIGAPFGDLLPTGAAGAGAQAGLRELS